MLINLLLIQENAESVQKLKEKLYVSVLKLNPFWPVVGGLIELK